MREVADDRNPAAHGASDIETRNADRVDTPHTHAGKRDFRLVLDPLAGENPIDVGAYDLESRIAHDLGQRMADYPVKRLAQELGVGPVRGQVAQIPAAADDRRAGAIRALQYRREPAVGVPSHAGRVVDGHGRYTTARAEKCAPRRVLPVTYQ